MDGTSQVTWDPTADFLQNIELASSLLQEATSLPEVATILADLAKTLAFNMGPIAYDPDLPLSHKDRSDLASVADLILDFLALVARTTVEIRGQLEDLAAVPVLGVLVHLIRYRTTGRGDDLLAADVAALLYEEQGWFGARSAADSVATRLILTGIRESPPWDHERRQNALTWLARNTRLLYERRRRKRRLRQLKQHVGRAAGWIEVGWIGWRTDPVTLSNHLLTYTRTIAGRISERRSPP